MSSQVEDHPGKCYQGSGFWCTESQGVQLQKWGLDKGDMESKQQ